ncbi:hypothetical protein FO519_001625 [Halicephalobus sp. NKZ332]|nr:hypothetical protein FO519_001625 [Halicephalobus sp. NKZ332]
MLHCPIGLLKTKSPFWARIWYDCLLSILTGTTTAVLSAFIYRYALLKGKLETIMNWKFLTFLAFLHIFIQAPGWVFLHICASNTTLIADLIVQRYPNIQKYFPNNDFACTTVDYTVEPPFPHLLMGYSMFSMSGVIPVIVILVYKSRKLLQKLLKALIFQLTVPTCTIMVPFTIVVICMTFGIGNVAYFTQADYVLGTLHSTMNTIMMIYFIKPYRNRLICCKTACQRFLVTNKFLPGYILRIWASTPSEVYDQ